MSPTSTGDEDDGLYAELSQVNDPLAAAIESMLNLNDRAQFEKAAKLLLTCVKNVLNNPSEQKFRLCAVEDS